MHALKKQVLPRFDRPRARGRLSTCLPITAEGPVDFVELVLFVVIIVDVVLITIGGIGLAETDDGPKANRVSSDTSILRVLLYRLCVEI